jgi:hypothetical protein
VIFSAFLPLRHFFPPLLRHSHMERLRLPHALSMLGKGIKKSAGSLSRTPSHLLWLFCSIGRSLSHLRQETLRHESNQFYPVCSADVDRYDNWPGLWKQHILGSCFLGHKRNAATQFLRVCLYRRELRRISMAASVFAIRMSGGPGGRNWLQEDCYRHDSQQ